MHPTTARIPDGALIEREIPSVLAPQNRVTLSLNPPDFTTAMRMAKTINEDLGEVGGKAMARDAASVDIPVPVSYQDCPVEFIARIGEDMLSVDAVAKVVINERSGTVVIGGNVTITPVAVAQGNLSITVNQDYFSADPSLPHKPATPTTGAASQASVKDSTVSLALVKGSTVDELVHTLNALKVSPHDVIAILQALKSAGALQAELVAI